MREISVRAVEETVRTLFLSACCEIGQDVLTLLEQAKAREESPFGRDILSQMCIRDRPGFVWTS